MSQSLPKTILTIHRIPVVSIIITCLLSLGMISTLLLSWTMWLVALLIALAWLPMLVIKTASLYRKYRWFALFFVLVVTQGAHLLEHVFQMIQIHILGIPAALANGLISILNTEVTHFVWNIWVLALTVALIFFFPRNHWLKAVLVVSIWHTIEHTYLLYEALKTGISGLPGLLGQGGLIGGGLPLSRPDLHFFYNFIEEALLLVAYLMQIRQIQAGQYALASSAQERATVAGSGTYVPS